MIVVKTLMRKMPESCSKCSCYVNGENITPRCRAKAGYSNGKPLINIAVYKERARWCPLVEKR